MSPGNELVRKWRKYTIPGSLSDYYMSLKDLESKAEIIWGRGVDQREKQSLFCSARHQSRTLYEERLVRKKQKNFMNTRSQRCLLTRPFMPLTLSVYLKHERKSCVRCSSLSRPVSLTATLEPALGVPCLSRHEGVCVFWTADSRSPGTLTAPRSLWSKPGKRPGEHKPQVQLLGSEGEGPVTLLLRTG